MPIAYQSVHCRGIFSYCYHHHHHRQVKILCHFAFGLLTFLEIWNSLFPLTFVHFMRKWNTRFQISLLMNVPLWNWEGWHHDQFIEVDFFQGFELLKYRNHIWYCHYWKAKLIRDIELFDLPLWMIVTSKPLDITNILTFDRTHNKTFGTHLETNKHICIPKGFPVL